MGMLIQGGGVLDMHGSGREEDKETDPQRTSLQPTAVEEHSLSCWDP